MSAKFITILVLICIVCNISLLKAASEEVDTSGNDQIGLSTAELVRLKGYEAEEHFVTTSDGYILSLVRATNPLIKQSGNGSNMEPILFIHGALSNAKCWITNSIGAEPRDYSHLNASDMSLEELNDLLQDDPSADSLAFLSVNFGREAWLLNTRGTSESQGHVNSTYTKVTNSFRDLALDTKSLIFGDEQVASFKNILKELNLDANETYSSNLLKRLFESPMLSLQHIANDFNPKYWNYSYDEVARYDVAQSIDYIIEKSGKPKVSVVGHSVGAASILMLLSDQPEYADKVGKALLFAPSLDLGLLSSPLRPIAYIIPPLLKYYVGPTSSALLGAFLQDFYILACQSETAQETYCNSFLGLLFGQTDQIKVAPGIATVLFESLSSHEFFQLAQSVTKGKMHFFDYQNPKSNQLAYGQLEPPRYDVSKIRYENNIAIWGGGKDVLVPCETIESLTLPDLKVPFTYNCFNEAGLGFNHLAFLAHFNVTSLLNIPSLKILEES